MVSLLVHVQTAVTLHKSINYWQATPSVDRSVQLNVKIHFYESSLPGSDIRLKEKPSSFLARKFCPVQMQIHLNFREKEVNHLIKCAHAKSNTAAHFALNV